MRNNMTRRAWLQSSTAALACLALPEYALGAAAEKNGRRTEDVVIRQWF